MNNKIKSNRLSAKILLISLSIFTISSCAPAPKSKSLPSVQKPKSSFHTTDFREVDKNPIPKDNFGPGEVPTLFLRNYNGQTVSIKIYSISTGALVKTINNYVPKDHNWRWYRLTDLANDSFKAELSVSGIVKESYLFGVSR